MPKNLQEKYPELSKNETPVTFGKRLYRHSLEDYHREIKDYPFILSPQEKNFVHTIVESSFERGAYAIESLIIKKKELYIFIEGNWHILQNKIRTHFTIDLDNVVFNEEKNLAMITVDKHNGWYQYVFKKEQDKWIYYSGFGIKITCWRW